MHLDGELGSAFGGNRLSETVLPNKYTRQMTVLETLEFVRTRSTEIITITDIESYSRSSIELCCAPLSAISASRQSTI